MDLLEQLKKKKKGGGIMGGLLGISGSDIERLKNNMEELIYEVKTLRQEIAKLNKNIEKLLNR